MHQSHNQWKVEKVGDLVGVVANLEARSLPEFGVVVVDIFHRVRQRFRHTREKDVESDLTKSRENWTQKERCMFGLDQLNRGGEESGCRGGQQLTAVKLLTTTNGRHMDPLVLRFWI